MRTWARSPPGPTPCSAGARPEDESRSMPAGCGSGWPTSRSTCRAPASAGLPGPRTRPGERSACTQGGRWLANSSADGLVVIEIDRRRGAAWRLFRRMKVTELIVSLVDPDGFIAAVQRDGVPPVHRRTEGMISHGTPGEQDGGAGPGRARPRRRLDMAGHPATAGRTGPGSKTLWRIASTVDALGSAGSG